MDYEINLSALQQKINYFDTLNNETNGLKTAFNNSYISSLSNTEIGSISNQINNNINKLSTAYNNCNEWFNSYYQDLVALENNLTNFSSANVTAPIDFAGQFTNVFSKKTIPTLQTGGDKTGLYNSFNTNFSYETNALTGNTNQEKIYSFFASKGLNDAAICGILANIEHESGFKTDIDGDGGTSYGICQWHDSRKANLIKYCKNNNLDYTTLDGQLAFLEYELETSYPDMYNNLKNTSNTSQGAYNAAYQWTIQFEKPKYATTQAKKRGNSAASTYWNAYSK